VPPAARRVLDVGCGPGGFGHSLRQDDPTRERWAVELDADVAATAADHYDRMVVGPFPDAVTELGARFDCIVFNDVLEHVVDPWATLRAATPLLAEGGAVVASIPNVRNARVVFDLAVRGNWTYTDIGILDRTHLRFFTARSIRQLFVDCGYVVQAMAGINPVGQNGFPGPGVWRTLLRDFAYTGFGVRAVPATRS
jgi:2-polyprenyl-3-methyl-5-hydroxy-6-metoxy-1,4-benzoquinol methylase